MACVLFEIKVQKIVRSGGDFMKRILHIGLSNVMGGIESYLVNLMQTIDSNKYQLEFLVFHQDEPKFQQSIVQAGGIIHQITSRNENYFLNKKDLHSFFQHHNFDTVHYHIVSFSYMTPIQYIPKSTKLVLHSHTSSPPINKRILFFHHLNKIRFLHRANLLLACSKDAAQFMFSNKKCVVLPNGINFERYSFNSSIRMTYREQLQLDNKTVLIHIGRFEKEKNHRFLIEMFSELIRKEGREYRLLLVGTGSLLVETKNLVKQLGLQKDVMFLGLRADIAELLSASDVLLMPSYYEGLPFALIEAQVNGLKCIVSTGVSNESNKNDRISFLPIDKGNGVWIKNIRQYSFNNWQRINDLQNSEYDIAISTKKLQEAYKKEMV